VHQKRARSTRWVRLPDTGYRPGWYPEHYGYSYYGVIPKDDFDRDVEPEYDEPYPLDLAVMVQTELARLGFYDGPISGVIGSRSQMAIREFQEAQGLPVTGQIDQNLVRELRSGEFHPTPPKDSFVTPVPSATCGSQARISPGSAVGASLAVAVQRGAGDVSEPQHLARPSPKRVNGGSVVNW
jgi:hypothetical protein